MERLKALFARVPPLSRRQILPILAIAGLVGVIVCAQAGRWTGGKGIFIEDPRYLVARRALPEGHPVHPLDFTLKPVRKGEEPIPAGALTDQDWELVEGRPLREPVSNGGFLFPEALGDLSDSPRVSQRIPKGSRAYSIRPVASPFLTSGDSVDVFARGAHEVNSRMVLQKVRVLDSRNGPEGREVVLSVHQSDVPTLEELRDRVSFSIVLRNESDDSLSPDRSRASRGRGSKTHPIEIWTEGGK